MFENHMNQTSWENFRDNNAKRGDSSETYEGTDAIEELATEEKYNATALHSIYDEAQEADPNDLSTEIHWEGFIHDEEHQSLPAAKRQR